MSIRYSAEAEEQVLGAALLSRSAVECIANSLEPNDFYLPAHQRIAGAIRTLYDAGSSVDVITVADALKVAGYDPDMGLLIAMQAGTVAPSGVDRHATIVRREASARRLAGALIEAGNRLAHEADPADIADYLEDQVLHLDRAKRLPERYWSSTDQYLGATPASSALEPLWDGGCWPRSRVVVLAPEKGGKSWLLRGLAVQVAAGLHPFTLQPITPVRTLVLDAENDDSELRRSLDRLGALLTQHPGAAHARPALLSAPYGLDLRSKRDRGEIESALEDCRPQLIVGGPIYKLMPRREKEDLDSHAAALQRILDGWRKRWGCALVIEHHMPSGRAGQAREERSKGGQIWAAWPECTIVLTPKTENGRKTLACNFAHAPRGDFRWPARFEMGQPHEWPWTAVMRAADVKAASRGRELPIDHPGDEEEAF